MVPVELRLSNFLSYGAEPQTLDFTQFHVACLSGKNGQGKSALLDAITWVLWGEARKSSGGHKPDDELLRIGARRMKVELVFDVEAVRYRVMRAYSRSATGKTSKAEMELQVLDSDSAEGRPITQSSIRESQYYLNEILGIDYHTFINSAFLLQGRSDEFTKKKPNERKDILGRILNLEKYDRLAAMAREHQRKLSDEVDLLKREIERLTLALESETEWKENAKQIEAELKLKLDALEEVRGKEASLVEQLGAVEAQGKAFEAVSASLAQMAEQKRLQEEEKGLLDTKIKTANELVSDAKEIEAQYQVVTKLIEEREALDSSREVYRGVEKQVEQKKSELQQLRLELEQKVHQMELELKVDRNVLLEIEAKLEGKAKYEEDLLEAKGAQERVEQMKAKIATRDQLKDKITTLEKAATGKRESVLGHVKSLEDRRGQLKKVQDDKDLLLKEKEGFESDVVQEKRFQGELEEITKEGQRVGEVIKSLEGEMGVLSQEKARVDGQLAQLLDIAQSQCPTCGIELTIEHRDEVAGQLRAHLADIERHIKKNKQEIDACSNQRELMRETFRDVKEKAESLAGAKEKIVKAGEKIKAILLKEEELRTLEEKISLLNLQMKEQTYAVDELDRIEALKQKLVLLPVADEELEKDRFKANQVVRYEEHLRNILHAEGRKESLLTKTKALKQQIDQARVKIERGERVKTLKEGLSGLERQLTSVGFNPVRFEEVRQNIKEMDNAQNQFKDLLNAQQNLSDWEAQRVRILKRIKQISTEIAGQQEKHQLLERKLKGKVDLESTLKAVKANRIDVEKGVQGLQIQSGELSARLKQAKEDKAALTLNRRRLKDLKAEENIYSKLRRAFSKQGIPSLIIEQSLPEIEERTNELLTRLTEGKMRVNLETLKDKKTGGTKETLEIIITDEQGVPRPYETYSGGEAFRVNFALRIALSQMLAERSGVRIRTLGIDEGFGTQDQEGIQNLIEALQVIQEDFDKIIVITHLERLKEAFPVRIEVEKHPVEGSTFTLIQN